MGVRLLGWFSALALALTALGLHGLVALAVQRRTREIGVRMAMGATSGQLLRLMLAQGLWTVIAGAAGGLGGALIVTRFAGRFLFGVSAYDAASFSEAVIVLVLAAGTAACLPAWRATRIDPVDALRAE